MGFKRKIANWIKLIVKGMVFVTLVPLGKYRRDLLFLELSQDMIPIKRVCLDGQRGILFFCPSYDTLYRAERFFNAEPETLKWIDSFKEGDIFWDIGANVGAYSLYAAVRKGIQVLSFEPSSPNYWILNKNIELNNLDGRVTALCLAFSINTMLGSFNMADITLGGACYRFGDNVDSFNYPGLGEKKVVFHQGMVGFSIDEFIRIFKPPFPTHMKIDVDGIEQDIARGGLATLGDNRLQSISIELDETGECVKDVMEILNKSGFSLAQKKHAPEISRYSAHIYNYLFARSSE